MAWILFIDESGQDHRESPYEVLAGVAVEDSRVWPLITAVHDAEFEFFGRRRDGRDDEMKAKKLLKRKTFRLAAQMAALAPAERAAAAAACLGKGDRHEPPTKLELTALGQAKIAFSERLLELAAQHRVRAFASIVEPKAPRPANNFLRKDYSYLFERFYNWLDDAPGSPQGIVVFDELEQTRSHILLGQMEQYFKNTATGQMRAGRIVPEPFFVHSDLTTGIRIADLIAYVISWGVRFPPMNQAARAELSGLARAIRLLRHRATVDRDGGPFYVWSFRHIADLRPRSERDADDDEK
ncbi:MAG TPA: DUF3800 domain-containing protein [Byssovorax sp.]